MPFQSIPVIDLAPLVTGDGASVQEVVSALDYACRNIGFFYIRNHGVAEDLCTGVVREAKRFFSLPEEEKLRYNIDDIGTRKRLRRTQGSQYAPKSRNGSLGGGGQIIF